MSRPEKPPKTEVAARLVQLRKEMGFPEREAFAEFLEISVGTLGSYERGDHAPSMEALAIYRKKLNVDLDWIMFGTGAPPLPTGSRLSIDAKLLGRLADMVQRTSVGAGIKHKPDTLTEEAGRLYNELLMLVPNPAETAPDVVDAMLSVVEARFKARLSAARTEPGTGKRLA